mgnify:CR=1 FL=1
MKGIILIISLFLSCVFSGTGSRNDILEGRSGGTVVSSTGRNTTEKKTDLNDFAILPARTASYSGDGNSFAPTFHPTNSGRRVQPSFKSSFCVIKVGKIFDRSNFYTFQTDLKRFSSGIHSTSRYIHSLCQLLI